MQYARLTKEQFQALHSEFCNFLALQGIDHGEWQQIKKDKPDLAEEELDLFSDMIWDKVLNKVEFLDHISSGHVFLFLCGPVEMLSIIVKTTHEEVDFQTNNGITWLLSHLADDKVSIHTGRKAYSSTRNIALFDLITQGAQLSDGRLYKSIAAAVGL